MGKLLEAYFDLHDILSNMIEGGRLTEADIPWDYQALLEQIDRCNRAYDELQLEVGDA